LYPQPSFSNPVFFTQTSKLKFPDIFTPNEDGSNDVFRCYSFFISDFEMKIFNAWGNSVYYSQNLAKGWDGKINGRPAPGGPYAYWAKGKDENGEIVEVRGYFNLVR
jgi:gliding motility-associated-like protein